MSASPTRKRPRTESEEDVVKQEPQAAPATPNGSPIDAQQREPMDPQNDIDSAGPVPRRDAEFWFSDGTVILVAKDVEFRVYGGLLAAHSSVFRAMFNEARPVRLIPLDEHYSIPCFVLQLTDAPEDLRHVLRIYASRQPTRYFDARKPTYHQISAYIRLGHKYNLKELYKQSLAILKRHYTTSLERWIKHDYWQPSHRDTGACYSIGIVNLARLVDEPTLLPTAMLVCIYTSSSDIVRGLEREDGTRETLTIADLGLCFQAMKDIQQAVAASIARTCEEVVASACETKESCVAALRLARLQYLDANVSGMRTRGEAGETGDPFQPIDEFEDVELNMCALCTEMVVQRDKKERQWLWSRLPELLDIEVPGWGRPVSQREPEAS